MNKIATFLTAASVAAVAGSASAAEIVVNVNYGFVADGPDLWVLLADSDGDGLAGYTTNADASAGFGLDPDDNVLGSGDTTFFASAGGTDFYQILTGSVPVENTVAGQTPGTPVYIAWFKGQAGEGLGSFTGGIQYGVLDLRDSPTTGAINGVIPALGTISPAFASGAALEEPYTTIPEPTSLALLAMGGLLVARRRRG